MLNSFNQKLVEMKKVAFFILIFVGRYSFASNYYVASTGNDSNSGTSTTTPFKSISRLNMLHLEPGDKIFFRRGDVFQGQLDIKQSGTAMAPIIIQSYGSGPQPVISGTESVSNWISQGNNIYKAAFSTVPVMVFNQDILHLPARFPNTGFLSIDEGRGSKKFYDAALTQSNSYWNGATLHNRMVRWDYGEHTVESFSNGNISIKAKAEYDFEDGWGYFFSDKYELLDTAGEFFFNKTLNQLFIWSVNLPTIVEASVHKYGILLNQSSYVIISDLAFTRQQMTAIYGGTGSTDIKIKKCTFTKIFSKAIEMSNVDNVLLSNNLITDILNKGVVLNDCRNVKVERNQIRRIGLLPGIASKDEIAYSAMEVRGNIEAGFIRFNVLDSVGYNGLLFSKNTVIEKNVIRNFCLTTDDGSGIYTWSNNDTINRNGTGCTISNNIVQNGLGNILATTDLSGFANGIYMDDASGNAQIKNNTIVNCIANGIYLHNSINNLVENNTVFHCSQTQMLLGQDELSTTKVAGNVIRYNILYSTNEETFPLQITNTEDSNLNFAIWSGNYYNNPYNSFAIYTQKLLPDGSNSRLYTVNDWRLEKDNSAKQSNEQWSTFFVTDTIGGNMIINGNFTNNADEWYCWSPDDDCSTSWGVNNQLNRGSLRLQSDYGVAYNVNYFPLNEGQFYQLSFSNIAPNTSGTTTVQSMDANTYEGLELNKYVPVGTSRLDHKIIFKPSYTSTLARINFYVNNSASDYWLDNVKLLKVNAIFQDPLESNQIFINETNAYKSFTIQQTLYDLNDNPVNGSFSLAPYTSKILLKKQASLSSSSSVAHIKKDMLQIHMFPNPANQFIQVRIKQPAHFLIITDIFGRQYCRIALNDNFITNINLQSWQPGIYLVSVYGENDNLVARDKFIKE
jgi:parallel beta-helix repeat protein